MTRNRMERGAGIVGLAGLVGSAIGWIVAPADRWAIAAYIRALQRSQNATPADVAPDQRAALP